MLIKTLQVFLAISNQENSSRQISVLLKSTIQITEYALPVWNVAFHLTAKWKSYSLSSNIQAHRQVTQGKRWAASIQLRNEIIIPLFHRGFQPEICLAKMLGGMEAPWGMWLAFSNIFGLSCLPMPHGSCLRRDHQMFFDFCCRQNFKRQKWIFQELVRQTSQPWTDVSHSM